MCNGIYIVDNDKAAVYAALNLIQNNTCLRFQELTESQSMTTPYIGYVKAYSLVSMHNAINYRFFFISIENILTSNNNAF